MNEKTTFSDLEKALEISFSRVTPDPGFVRHLHERLCSDSRIEVEQQKVQQAYILITFGLFSGVFIYWLIRKLYRAKIFTA